MALFYGWGSTTSRLEPLQWGSLLFTTRFPEIPGTHFIDLGKIKGWVDLGATQQFENRNPGLGIQHHPFTNTARCADFQKNANSTLFITKINKKSKRNPLQAYFCSFAIFLSCSVFSSLEGTDGCDIVVCVDSLFSFGGPVLGQ